MKKGVSISLVLLLLTAMLNISVATHYCGGKVAASKVSLTGKLANCGMEGSGKKLPLSGTSFTTHCCYDVVGSYGIDNNYTPSFSFTHYTYHNYFQIFRTHTVSPDYTLAELKPLYTVVNPPGVLRFTNVDLTTICVFRI